jgi:hypothetical protein
MVAFMQPALASACRTTPLLAAQAFLKVAETSSAVESTPAAEESHSRDDSFRVHHVTEDFFTRQRWAWIETCNAPERPWTAVLLPGRRIADGAEFAGVSIRGVKKHDEQGPVEVRAGEVVDVVHDQDALMMHVVGRALMSGRRGETIRVLITAFDSARAVRAIVIGPGVASLTF